jgi:hypothetical protein
MIIGISSAAPSKGALPHETVAASADLCLCGEEMSNTPHNEAT